MLFSLNHFINSYYSRKLTDVDDALSQRREAHIVVTERDAEDDYVQVNVRPMTYVEAVRRARKFPAPRQRRPNCGKPEASSTLLTGSSQTEPLDPTSSNLVERSTALSQRTYHWNRDTEYDANSAVETIEIKLEDDIRGEQRHRRRRPRRGVYNNHRH